MNGAGEMEREPEGDDVLAAEYVLGLQTAEERAAVGRRVEESRDFARLVDWWETRFWPMAAEFAEVTPPASVKARIDRLLFSSAAQAAPGERSGFWNSLAVWRTLAIGSLAALVAFAALPFLNPPAPENREQLVASLAADGSDVQYLVMFDGQTGEVGLSHLSGAPASGQTFQLWVIKGTNAPKSAGLVPVGESARITLPTPIADAMEKGDVFAISLEPSGGSPTGQPTGPVVAAGGLTQI
ncbi:anti-sigma K factor RskA [Tianweitania populi]|uniref:Anti-sigma K factor RskA n=1 Tax=Tianweitania populi TaxID=1607949 RepID=A0A8J3GJY8_9HYPH|nr:anti-sigma factor [Tianweitania populi]GHD14830.1 anti-sigma K factor RskA [Tianweitania populi]